jgi:hypothetical protein
MPVKDSSSRRPSQDAARRPRSQEVANGPDSPLPAPSTNTVDRGRSRVRRPSNSERDMKRKSVFIFATLHLFILFRGASVLSTRYRDPNANRPRQDITLCTRHLERYGFLATLVQLLPLTDSLSLIRKGVLRQEEMETYSRNGVGRVRSCNVRSFSIIIQFHRP